MGHLGAPQESAFASAAPGSALFQVRRELRRQLGAPQDLGCLQGLSRRAQRDPYSSLPAHATVLYCCVLGVPFGSLGLDGSHWSDALEALVAREFLEVAQDPDLRRKEQWSKTAAAQVRQSICTVDGIHFTECC